MVSFPEGFPMSDTRSVPRCGRDPAATRQLWADRLHRFRAAGTTVTAFCQAEGVSVPSFYHWKKQLTRTPAPVADAPTVIPVRLTTPALAHASVEVVLVCGTCVRLPADTRPEVIVAILRGVEGRTC
jgi:transposase